MVSYQIEYILQFAALFPLNWRFLRFTFYIPMPFFVILGMKSETFFNAGRKSVKI